MTFTLAALGGTLLIAGIPNAFGVITGDIEKIRPDVARNISANGDPYALKRDLGKLQSALRWLVALLVCQILIWLIVLALAVGPLWLLAIIDRVLHSVSWWRANYNSIFQGMQGMANANSDSLDRIVGGICLVIAVVLWYWRGWSPFIKGCATAWKAKAALKQLEGG